MSTPRPLRAALVAGVLLAGGCSTAQTDTRAETLGVPDVREEVEDEVWRLEAGSGVDVDGTVTMEIDGDAIEGTTPCGSYLGEFHLDHDDLEVTHVNGGTRCDDAEERGVTDYLDALTRATSAEVDDDHLVLEGDDVRLEFEETDG